MNFETKIAGEEPKPIEENNQLNPQPEITNNTADQNSLQQEVQPTTITTEQIIDPDQEEGEERNVLRIIKKKISKSSSRSDSDQRSKKKKEKKHSKKKSKKSDKKNKKKKNKKSSSRSDSSDSEN